MTTQDSKQQATNLTDDEARALDVASDANAWNFACRAVKLARGGEYPTDWFPRVVLSGFAAQKEEQFKGGPAPTLRIAPPIEMATLRTGVVVPMGLVKAYLIAIRALMKPPTPPITATLVFYELVEKAKDRKHVFFGDLGKRLEAAALIDSSGCVPEQLVPIVLASAEGEGLTLRFVDPIRP